MLKLEVKPYTFHFKFSARTSRGVMNERKVWFLNIYDQKGNKGIGEVAPIDQLSPEDIEEVPSLLKILGEELTKKEVPRTEAEVFSLVEELVSSKNPSICFGLEIALLDIMNGGQKHIFRSDTYNIKIPINGLVWMGDRDFMQKQINEKLEAGFNCIKLKIGAFDFEDELEIIRGLRKISDNLIIRLDVNGAFHANEALFKLKKLYKYNIHSVEQPIMPKQPEAMELICNHSEIPIALDEELIGVDSLSDRITFLQRIKPQYLVLKPMLHGGFSSTKKWIELAEIYDVEWWVTSYLESNIGLSALAQFTSLYPKNKEHHGLGTGSLYRNNIASPILIDQGYFRYTYSDNWGM